MAKVAKAIVGGILLLASFVIPGTQGWLTALGWSLIVGNALDFIAQALVDNPKARALGQQVEYNGTVEPRRIVYGEQKVSGMNAIPPWTSGAKNEHLHQVLVLCGHEIDSYSTVWADKIEILTSAITTVAGNKNDGKVTSGQYQDVLWVRRYVGTSGQTADYILNNAFTEWTSNHRFRGIAYAAMKYQLDDEKYEHGKPTMTFLLRGRKCYDPSLDSTPGADPTNAAFKVWTTNPALCVVDYLLSADIGVGEDPTLINWDTVMTAAAICDEDVTIPPASPTTEQKRYTCNLTLYVAQDDSQLRENLGTLAQCMMGYVVFRSGKWCVHAGAAITPLFALTGDDFGPRGYQMRTETPTNQKYNYVRGQFVDADREYQLQEFEPIVNSTYETDDLVGRLPREVLFLGCNDQFEAQRNAIIVSKRSRRRYQLTAQLSMSGFTIRPWDVGTITNEEIGWDAQLVRCTAWTFNPEGYIDATFIEEDNNDWLDPEVADYILPTVGTGVIVGSRIPDAPASINIQSLADGVMINVEYPATWIPTDRFRVYMYTAASPFASASVVVQADVSNHIFVPLTSTSDYYFWVTTVGRFGQTESGTTPTGNGQKGKALSITTGFRNYVDRASHFRLIEDSASGTTQYQSTITWVNASAAPTHSWVRTSGSTKISVVSSTAASTYFSVASLAHLENVSAVFTCTSTSSGASPTTSAVTVTVTFERNDNGYL